MSKRWWIVGLLWSSSALAVPYVPKERLVEHPGQPAKLVEVRPQAPSAADAMAQLGRLVEFEKKMQYTMTCDLDAGTACNLGGVIEVESGPGNQIIESDNTQEAIWDWSFLKNRGGNFTYQSQIDAGFAYLSENPGWLECNDGCAGSNCCGTYGNYYSWYNCGWGLRAVVEYENATGDMSQRPYATMCAAHLSNLVNLTPVPAQLIDMGPAMWGASGLWIWADHIGDANLKATAAQLGSWGKTWLMSATMSRASAYTWATTGGAVFYGVVNSYMKEHPSELSAFAQLVAPVLGGWIDETTVANPNDWTDWRNAWNAWNMLGHFAAYHALGEHPDDPHLATALDIYSRIIAQDTDMDGGIQGSQQRPATEDESWITSYSAYFGIREILALPASPPDAGAGGAGGSGGSGGSSGSGDSGGCAATPIVPAGSAIALVGLAIVTALATRRRRR